jgi:Domain of unknown function (DUF4388)
MQALSGSRASAWHPPGRHLRWDTGQVTAEKRQGSGYDWDDARKAALFADIVSLKLSIDGAAALHGLRVDVIQEWLRQFRRSTLVAFDERLKKTLIDQGANADALTAAEFTGYIEDVSIADLVQTIEIAGKDAVISVTHEGTDSRIWCSAGAIIDAESGRLTGEAAIYRILGFERGRMVADLRPEQRRRTIHAATHRLLIEALRRKDESLALERKLGNINRLYRLGERSTSSRVRVSTDELSLLCLFDGPRRLGEVLAQSPIGDLETLTSLMRLVDDGYLVETDSAPASARVPAERRSVPAERRSVPSGPRPRAKTKRLDHDDEHDPAQQADSSRTKNVDVATATSFVPLAASRPPERTTRPRGVFAAIAAALLAPGAFWFGETMSDLHATRRALGAAGEEQSESAALAPAPTFSLSTSVDPASSVIWLDRHPVASGRLDLALPRDGSTHELRVAAPGFIPVTLMFADVPPPREIRLKSLPTGDPSLEPSPAPAAASAGRSGPTGMRHHPSAAADPDGRATTTTSTTAAAAASSIELLPPEEPHVQIIEEDAPQVRAVE